MHERTTPSGPVEFIVRSPTATWSFS